MCSPHCFCATCVLYQAGAQDPDIFFTDRPRESGLGQRNKEYLSIWADNAPVLPGAQGPRTPMQTYQEFMVAFKDAFHDQLGSLIEEVVVGTGPCGELRYPSYVEANGWRFPGVGEFQCYDRRALASLASAAAAVGRPEWGYAGPHDSGGYNSSPGDTGFFAPRGSWNTEYGSFFLGWYSSCLLQHGGRLLHLANDVFGPYKNPTSPADGPLAQAQAIIRRLQDMVTGSSCTGYTSSDGSSSSFMSKQFTGAQGELLASSILQQLQREFDANSSLALMAAGEHVSIADGSSSGSIANALLAAAADVAASHSSAVALHVSSSAIVPMGHAVVSAVDAVTHVPAEAASGAASVAAAAAAVIGAAIDSNPSTIASVDSGSVPDSDFAGLLSASQQQLAGLSLACSVRSSSGSRASDLSNSSCSTGGSPQRPPGKRQLPHSDSTASSSACSSLPPVTLSSGSTASSLLACATAGNSVVEASPADAAVAAAGSKTSTSGTSASTASGHRWPGNVLQRGPKAVLDSIIDAAAKSLASLAAAAARPAQPVAAATLTQPVEAVPVDLSTDISSNSNDRQPANSNAQQVSSGVAAAAPFAGDDISAAGDNHAVLQMFVNALARLGLDASSEQSTSTSNSGSSKASTQQQQRDRCHQQQLVLTLKIAGVHWWYNSTSHASELTAGYYNTDSRDGYLPVIELCEKHGVNLTLTCVEMCDAQHPSYALCGPEGLLRQIRAMAAQRSVSLSGENALPIFTQGGVDGPALDRVVANVRVCRAAPLRSCSSWPGPGISSAIDASFGKQQFHTMQGNHPYYSSSQHSGQQYHQVGPSNGVHGGYYTIIDGSDSQLQQLQQLRQQQQQAYQHRYGAGMGTGSNILNTGRTFSELGTLLAYDSAPVAAAAPAAAIDAGSCASNSSSGSSQWHLQQPLQQQQQQHQPSWGCEVFDGTQMGSSSYHAVSPGWSSGYQPAATTGAAASAGGLTSQAGPAGLSAASSQSSRGNEGGKAAATAAATDTQLLPAMRAFTFLRLGPELLQPDCYASWTKFMHRMLNERA
eukprot:GHRR01005741.1.p1 GENE.GHRR01005741.1~~GHRR01005741.1.p1  ORF type:complete len:1044 (+),score=501.89 GHRR01005741.1:1438-4569(+)